VHFETYYKLGKFHENCARHTPLWVVYIQKFNKILVKFSVAIPLSLHRWGEIWHGGPSVHSSMPNFTPIMHHVAPAG